METRAYHIGRKVAVCHPDRIAVSGELCDACRLKRDYSKRKVKIQEWNKAHPERRAEYAQQHYKNLAAEKLETSKVWKSLCPTCRVTLLNALDEGFKHLWD